jgi:enterochelin esterase-like enzyme
LGVAALVCAAVLTSLAFRSDDTAARQQDTDVVSHAIGGRLHYIAYLPQNYGQDARRYPVVYLLQGLPGGANAYRGVRYVEQALDATGQPAILIAPQGSSATNTDPEYLDTGPGSRWDTAITIDLVKAVDARYRTIPSRTGRALVGVSAGGYGAMHLALSHLDLFGAVESWSGYFHPTDPSGTKALDVGSAAANAAADVHRQFAVEHRTLKALKPFIAFYVGRDDTRFRAENEQLNQELSHAGIPHVFRLYPGGHDQKLWQTYAIPWLALALAHLDPPTAA